MSEFVVKTENLKKWFPLRQGIFDALRGKPSQYLKAVDGVSFDIRPGEIFCLAGESGCGKTTTGRLMLRLLDPTEGHIFFDGIDITSLEGKELKTFRKKAQIIFQDPYESLSPTMSILDIVTEPLVIHNIGSKNERIEYAIKALEDVALKPAENFLRRYPHELSGGQRQRVAIARAIILKPKFIVADEPVSMLDMSIRAGILKLMLDIRERYKITYLFITHDLAIAKHICDRIAIMYLGKIVEIGSAEQVINSPHHPYTKALVAAIPIPNPLVKVGDVPIRGEVPSPINLPAGCRFHPRCPYAIAICKQVEPNLVEVEHDHMVACHLYQ